MPDRDFNSEYASTTTQFAKQASAHMEHKLIAMFGSREALEETAKYYELVYEPMFPFVIVSDDVELTYSFEQTVVIRRKTDGQLKLEGLL